MRKYVYHVGKCAGVTKTAYKSMEPVDLLSWICGTCKVHSQRQASQAISQEVATGYEAGAQKHEAMMAQILETNKKLTVALSRIENIESKLNIQSSKHDNMIEKLNNQEKTIESIECSTIMISKQYDDLIKKVDSLARVTHDLKGRTNENEWQGHERDARIKELEGAVENAEQYSRRKNIEIHGIAQQDREDLPAIVKNLAAKLSISVPQPDKIESMHRLKAREGKIAPFIVRFKDGSERDFWVSKRMALKSERVFINENLTKLQRWLFWNAKECARASGFQYVWIKNGKIWVRKRQGANAVRIENDSDLDKIR